MSLSANVIGAGLAGAEAAWQLALRGVAVRLYEMKPEKRSPAHKADGFAELVCSNSLRSDDSTYNAVGLLHQEMRLAGSLVMESADKNRVPAGGALAVDREDFSAYITARIREHPLITVDNRAAAGKRGAEHSRHRAADVRGAGGEYIRGGRRRKALFL